MKKENKNITYWDDHLDKKYGKPGTSTREKYEQEFEAFKLGVLIQEARKRQNLTQQQLAEKVGTTKNYISRKENNTMRYLKIHKKNRQEVEVQILD
ncbi:MAG: helix-turn-helix transcriptional regulator [Mangrovibacterium sp.]|nr:helix-turn-helix transcriptional regulator [Mangrovibacterium sp.]